MRRSTAVLLVAACASPSTSHGVWNPSATAADAGSPVGGHTDSGSPPGAADAGAANGPDAGGGRDAGQGCFQTFGGSCALPCFPDGGCPFGFDCTQGHTCVPGCRLGCTSSADCCEGDVCGAESDAGAPAGIGGGRCCKGAGGSPAGGVGCCPGLATVVDFSGGGGESCCVPDGGSCASTSDCCSGVCAGGTCACGPVGGPCKSDGDCCSQICDADAGVCGCRGGSAGCSSSVQCCEGLQCLGPADPYPGGDAKPHATCVALAGSPCNSDVDCAGPAAWPPPGACGYGAYPPCQTAACVDGGCTPSGVTAPCLSDSDCAPPGICRGGVCCGVSGMSCGVGSASPGDCCGKADITGYANSPNCTCGQSQPGQGCATNADCAVGGCVGGYCAELPQGAPCRAATDCLQGVCVGGKCGCTSNADCTAGACLDGGCSPLPVGASCEGSPSTCASDACGDAGVCCVPQGTTRAPCFQSSDCCLSSDECVPFPAQSGDGPGGYCSPRPGGSPCTADAQCPMDQCSGGKCACLAPHATCLAGQDAYCCTGLCLVPSCGSLGCTPPPGSCFGCTSDADCCGTGGTCDTATYRCTSYGSDVGSPCSANAPCCGGTVCENGVCEKPPTCQPNCPTCVPPGQPLPGDGCGGQCGLGTCPAGSQCESVGNCVVYATGGSGGSGSGSGSGSSGSASSGSGSSGSGTGSGSGGGGVGPPAGCANDTYCITPTLVPPGAASCAGGWSALWSNACGYDVAVSYCFQHTDGSCDCGGVTVPAGASQWNSFGTWTCDGTGNMTYLGTDPNAAPSCGTLTTCG